MPDPLLVNYEYPGVTTNCGGGGRVTELLLEELSARGSEPELVTDIADGHYATFPFRIYRDLREQIETTSPSILHGHFSLPSSLPLPRLASQHDIPLVVSVMGADVYDPSRFGVIRPLADRANEYIFDCADRIVAPSTDMLDRLPPEYLPKTEVIHYGIDPTSWDYQKREQPEEPDILTVARLVDRKNLRTAIEAVERLRSHGVSANYRIVGTGPNELELKELASERDWLTISGYVDDLQSAYDAADIFFLPSHHEAFGMVFLEALACGLPVVASDVGGQTDIVTTRVGVTASPDNPGMLKAALWAVVDDYERRQGATRERVEGHFSQSQMAAEYDRLYQEVAADA